MNKYSINFQSDSQKLVGTLFYPETEKKNLPAVIFYHGRGSRQERYFERAEAVCKKGFITFTFSFRGCGDSEGDFSKLTLEDGITDALAAFDYLQQQENVDKKRIGVYGNSYGGYLGSIISEQRPIPTLLLDAPAIYKDEWMHLAYEDIPIDKISRFRHVTDFENNIAISAIRKYTSNLLVIRHENDEVIPEEVVKAYYANATATKHKEFAILKDAPHRLEGEYYQQSTIVTVDWFKKYL